VKKRKREGGREENKIQINNWIHGDKEIQRERK
jgi:hypothetical protein